jgi:hypothetical protein
MAATVAIQDEIAQLEKKLEDVQTQLSDAKTRLAKAQEESKNGDVGANLSLEEKMDLISDNLQEMLNPEICEKALRETGHLKVYWGTATTGIRAQQTGLESHADVLQKEDHTADTCVLLDIKVGMSCAFANGVIVRSHPQDRPVSTGRMPCKDFTCRCSTLFRLLFCFTSLTGTFPL